MVLHNGNGNGNGNGWKMWALGVLLLTVGGLLSVVATMNSTRITDLQDSIKSLDARVREVREAQITKTAQMDQLERDVEIIKRTMLRKYP